MKIEQRQVNDIPILALHGRFDAMTSEHLEERLKSVIDGGARNICLDLNAVEFISSSALRVLLTSLKEVKKNEGIIVLAAMPSHVREVFDLAGFLELFAVQETCEEALKIFE